MQKVQLAIARRVHELFEARGPEHGNDLEDSFRAREAGFAAHRLANQPYACCFLLPDCPIILRFAR
jgi:hypothetical protein